MATSSANCKEMVMASLNPQPLPPVYRPLEVHLPAEILYDLEAFQKIQSSILGKTGHPLCTSGMQFLWQAYEQWAVDPAGDVQPVLPANSVALGDA